MWRLLRSLLVLLRRRSYRMRKERKPLGISLIISLVLIFGTGLTIDPLMYTIMENPVILPTSKISIDLSTIKSHLLSDPTDPFNRTPLKIEDVIPSNILSYM